MSPKRYTAFAPIDLPDRRWPGKRIEQAPLWCSVDLRDGNQALPVPMGLARKRRMFDTLLDIGFKQIEIGFPAASEPDYAFVRALIEEDRIPEDVTIQVLTQAREKQIRRSVESIRGARRAIVHLYNSTSTLQRRVVFGLDRAGIREIAVRGARLIADLRETVPETEIVLEYSPESFTATELDFGLEICEAVMDVWKPTPAEPIILNLPATVEMATPNVYADQIEWFGDHIRDRDAVLLSVHPHNDRGTAVAATELAVMAGADRVEGTLFGNGERTGNVDLITLALNLFTQGIDPKLTLANIDEIIEAAEFCNQLPVHPRHPYAGELVYTAFSGSHQDAIKKGLAALRRSAGDFWEVPYLPIDPADVGRSYQAVVRVTSQSGKGGVAYLLERDHGLQLPRNLQIEFGGKIQKLSEASGGEISSHAVWQHFVSEYLAIQSPIELLPHPGKRDRMKLGKDQMEPGKGGMEFWVRFEGHEKRICGAGNGPIAALVDALKRELGVALQVVDYHEHAVGVGADAMAIAYVELDRGKSGTWFGVGRHADSTVASLEAVVAGANRHLADNVSPLGSHRSPQFG
jgi:2-isopropylmalate synthase